MQNGVCDGAKHASENLGFELREALVRQTRNRTHFNIKSVKVLEEPLHPLDHHLMIFPPELQLFEKLLPVKRLQSGSYLRL
jgi:hypothetical protein